MIGAEEQDWGPADTFDMVPGGARMQVLVSISSSGPCMKVGSLDSFLTFSCSTTGLHVWMDGLMGRGKYGGMVVVGLAYRLFRLGPGAWGDAGKGKGDCGVQRAASARAPPSHPIVTSLLSLSSCLSPSRSLRQWRSEPLRNFTPSPLPYGLNRWDDGGGVSFTRASSLSTMASHLFASFLYFSLIFFPLLLFDLMMHFTKAIKSFTNDPPFECIHTQYRPNLHLPYSM